MPSYNGYFFIAVFFTIIAILLSRRSISFLPSPFLLLSFILEKQDQFVLSSHSQLIGLRLSSTAITGGHQRWASEVGIIRGGHQRWACAASPCISLEYHCGLRLCLMCSGSLVFVGFVHSSHNHHHFFRDRVLRSTG